MGGVQVPKSGVALLILLQTLGQPGHWEFSGGKTRGERRQRGSGGLWASSGNGASKRLLIFPYLRVSALAGMRCDPSGEFSQGSGGSLLPEQAHEPPLGWTLEGRATRECQGPELLRVHFGPNPLASPLPLEHTCSPGPPVPQLCKPNLVKSLILSFSYF